MAENETEAPPKTRKKGKTIILISLIVFLAAGGTGGTYFFFFKKPAKAEKKPPKMGPVTSLESFVVNLNEPGGNRYLKITLDIETEKPLTDESKLFLPRLRDRIIIYLSELTIPKALNPQTKPEIKKRVQEIGNSIFGKGALVGVYFKEYVMQ